MLSPALQFGKQSGPLPGAKNGRYGSQRAQHAASFLHRGELQEGGAQIEYEDEDREIHGIFAARDISTVVLLSTGQTRTLSVLMLEFATEGQFEKAAVVGVLIVLFVVIAALIARALGSRVSLRSEEK